MRSPKHVLGKYLCHFLFTLRTAILNLSNPLSNATTTIAMITRIKSNFFLYSHIIETYSTSVMIDLFSFRGLLGTDHVFFAEIFVLLYLLFGLLGTRIYRLILLCKLLHLILRLLNLFFILIL